MLLWSENLLFSHPEVLLSIPFLYYMWLYHNTSNFICWISRLCPPPLTPPPPPPPLPHARPTPAPLHSGMT